MPTTFNDNVTARRFLGTLYRIGVKTEVGKLMVTNLYGYNTVSALKELYSIDDDIMKDLVFNSNPFLKLLPKDDK